MTRIDIISGFLGAGKTTWLNTWLNHPLYKPFTPKTIILENEFGEINLDAILLQNMDMTISELTAGCICCTISGDFNDKLLELIETYQPDRIIIEPTGVAKLSEVLEGVKQLQRRQIATLGQAMTVLDATSYDLYLENFADFYKNQIKHAHHILVNRDEHLTSKERAQLLTSIQSINSSAIVHFLSTTETETLVATMDLSFDAFSQNDFFQITQQAHHHHHEHDTFVSHTIKVAQPIDHSKLKDILERLIENQIAPDGIIRIKGIVETEKGNTKIDYTGARLELSPWLETSPQLICFIGQNLDLDDLKSQFL